MITLYPFQERNQRPYKYMYNVHVFSKNKRYITQIFQTAKFWLLWKFSVVCLLHILSDKSQNFIEIPPVFKEKPAANNLFWGKTIENYNWKRFSFFANFL